MKNTIAPVGPGWEFSTLSDNSLGLRNLGQEEVLHFIRSRRIHILPDFLVRSGNLPLLL